MAKQVHDLLSPEVLESAARLFKQHGKVKRALQEAGADVESVDAYYSYRYQLRSYLMSSPEPTATDEQPPTPPPATDDKPVIKTSGDTVSYTGSITTLDQLLDAAEVDKAHWRVRSWTANVWDGADGKAKWQTKAHLERLPNYLVTKEYEPLPRVMKEDKPGAKKVLYLSDAHIGFNWSFDTKEMVPYHDEDCLQLAVEVARRTQPQVIVLGGDLLDLAAWSTKFSRTPEQRYLTQPALDRLREWLLALRAACPTAEIVYLGGNHEDRISRYLQEKADELIGLRDDAGLPLLSLESLLSLPSIDVSYAQEHWVGNVRFIHGTLVRSGGGATAAVALKNARQCLVYGHIHRTEYGARTVVDRDGTITYWAASAGCLCRVDGAVPGANESDWQQGMGLVTVLEDGTAVWSLLPVVNKSVLVDGVVVRSEVVNA